MDEELFPKDERSEETAEGVRIIGAEEAEKAIERDDVARRLPHDAPRYGDRPDAPPVEVHFLDFPDKELNELGARGIGEIGLAGVAAAITAAVHHATGVRVRELPVRIEDLLS